MLDRSCYQIDGAIRSAADKMETDATCDGEKILKNVVVVAWPWTRRATPGVEPG